MSAMRQLANLRSGLLAFMVIGTTLTENALLGSDASTDSSLPDASAIDKSIHFLERIEQGYVESQRALTNILVHGRISRVTVPFIEGNERPTTQSITPSWRTFTLARRGNNARYEEDFKTFLRGPDDQRVYRILNASGSARLDGPAMYIGAVQDPSHKLEHFTGAIDAITEAYDGTKFAPLPEICQSLIERFKEQRFDAPNDGCKLQCTERDGLIKVDCSVGTAACPHDFTFTVDTNKGFNICSLRLRVGGPGQGIDHEFLRTVEYDEVLPGVYFQRNGVDFFSHEGLVDKRDKTAGFTSQIVEATHVQVGEFEYDNRLFEFDSLAIAKGTMIIDKRTQPPLEFRFGEAPLDEQLLRSRLAEREPIRSRELPPTRYSMLLVLNALILGTFAIMVGRRLAKS